MTNIHPGSLKPTQRLPACFRDERGLSTVEYVIILVLIASASVVGWQMLGGTIKDRIGGSDTTIRTMDGDGSNGQAQSPTVQSPSAPQQPAAPAKRQAKGKVED